MALGVVAWLPFCCPGSRLFCSFQVASGAGWLAGCCWLIIVDFGRRDISEFLTFGGCCDGWRRDCGGSEGGMKREMEGTSWVSLLLNSMLVLLAIYGLFLPVMFVSGCRW